ncbi:MAG: septal ring lytic transglycosylase RlpA family protein [Burkholderiales bacterium]
MKRRLQRLSIHLLITTLLLALAACASEPATRPEPKPGDGPSAADIKAGDVKDAVPRNEPQSAYGNRSPYTVYGKKYYVLDSSAGYVQRGTASWYGSKFHGHQTSSGERYDMHLATAAHKTLPLPTYAEVTNLDNGKTVIVKINDRGPFKDGRLIDMSYGAALRLDMLGSGTVLVEVRAIDTGKLPAATSDPADVSDTWLQVGAFGHRDGAEQLAARLASANLKPVSIQNSGKLFLVWLGPYSSNLEINRVTQRAVELGFERPHKVQRRTPSRY